MRFISAGTVVLRKTRAAPFLLSAILSSVLIVSGVNASFGQTLSPGSPMKVFGRFKAPSSDKHSKPRGISGMGCLGKADDVRRECFVVNDEERFGEIATLTKDGISPTGKTVAFVEKGEPGKAVLGSARDPRCRDETGNVAKGKFDELDGEGVAIDGEFVYVASSHSCSGSGRYKPSSYLLARFKLNSSSSFPATPYIERSWRIADALLDSEVKEAYGKPKGEGTNIEGIAVIGGRLYVGLRTPVTSEASFILSAPTKELFAPGVGKLKDGLTKTIKVKLGANTGIRDLAALGNSDLLILSGPTLEQKDVEFKLWLLEKPDSGAQLRPLATFVKFETGTKGEIAKAEAIAVLSHDAGRLKVLVLYDNIDEAAPMQHEISLDGYTRQ
ncbi:DUF3616 domain-containing protein [Bradyrhizobium australiense]|uniref:DUF3616 domain-containing protein n=1 Tax=Bradyrhizobium australiense TaxID=2721161 RepID=A0A7Y4GPG1_9BRAD|nr:DUF3616 domain-containing protein [Bradyrhizobium australiense]NOJ39057.1 DUF3616 domain-containing protein [Bradyrhizobium australiense]